MSCVAVSSRSNEVLGSSTNKYLRPWCSWRVLVGLAMLSVASGQAAKGQSTAQSQPPQIVVTATGEVKVSPDKASIQLGVETQALTAAAASQENNKKQTAVLAAIKALGIPASAISTSNYSVNPIQRWNESTKRTVIDGYQVSNLVIVEVAKIEQTGSVIDAALGAGSNRVVNLSFELSDPSKAREEALTKAVSQARRDADIAAKAAGGSVSDLVEIVVNQFEQPSPRPVMLMRTANAAATPTPVSEGTMSVQVSVTTRWLYAKPK